MRFLLWKARPGLNSIVDGYQSSLLIVDDRRDWRTRAAVWGCYYEGRLCAYSVPRLRIVILLAVSMTLLLSPLTPLMAVKP